MPTKRQYNVKGTNDFMVLAAIFFFLCLWAIKDAWFPSEKVVKKHPSEIPVTFSVAGSVEKVLVKVGDTIGEDQLLAKLRTDRFSVEYEDAKDVFTEAKITFAEVEHQLKSAEEKGTTGEDLAEIKTRVETAHAEMDNALKLVTELKASIDDAELIATSKGTIKEVKIGPHSMVDVDEVVMVIDPKDHFYLFNKSLAIFSFIAFWAFLAIHILAR